MSNSGIYSIVNTNTGDMYIGSALSFSKRKSTHFCLLRKNKHHSVHLQNAWNKYGEDSFEFRIIEFVSDTRQLIIREQYFLDTLNPKYNIMLIADRPTGVTRSLETRHKISLAARNISPETRLKMSNAKKNATGEELLRIKNLHKLVPPVSQETRAKLSKALKGRKFPDEEKKKRGRSPMLGTKKQPLSQEVKDKISAALKNRLFSAETRAKLKEAWNRRRCKVSEETRNKMSASAKRRCAKLREENDI